MSNFEPPCITAEPFTSGRVVTSTTEKETTTVHVRSKCGKHERIFFRPACAKSRTIHTGDFVRWELGGQHIFWQLRGRTGQPVGNEIKI